jgi:hypothetical protein
MHFIICSIVYFISSTILIASEVSPTWKSRGVNDGVEVFSADIPGSQVVAFRGVATIKSSIQKLVTAMYDMERKKEWMYELEEIKVLRYLNKNERIEYYHSATPWPLDDRDFVYRSKFQLKDNNRIFTLKLEGASDAKAPEKKGIVRGKLEHSSYVFTSLGNNLTKVEVEILADPKGLVPKWIVNLFQKSWPSNTIGGLRNLVTSSNFVVVDEVKQFFKRNK